MHICGHVFMVSKYNLHAKHPTFTNLIDEYYSFKTQNCIEDDEPLNAQPVATLLWPSVGVKPNTWKKRGFGVLRDSRMFRARQQGAKHLALGCSWCRWKGLET